MSGLVSAFLLALPAFAQEPLIQYGAAEASFQLYLQKPVIDHIDIGGIATPSLTIPGFGHRIEPGRIVVPTKRVLVDIPDGVDVSIRVNAREEFINIPGLRAAPKLVPAESVGAPITNPSGSNRGGPRIVAIDPDVNSGAAAPPHAWARIEYVGHYGARRVASVLVEPVEASPHSSTVHYVPFINITIVHTPPPHGGTLLLPAAPSHKKPPPPAAASPSLFGSVQMPQPQWQLKIEVKEKGLYQIKLADLVAAGIPASVVDPRRVALFHLGKMVPIRVDGESDGILDINDRILFYGEPADHYYTRNNAYFLEQLAVEAATASAAARWRSIDGTVDPNASFAPSFRQTVRAELDISYYQLMPNGEGKDHWFYKKSLAPSLNSFTLQLLDPLPAAGANSIGVRASLHGYTNTTQNPDHHTKVKYNGTVVSDATWDGMVPFLHNVYISDSLITSGTNTVTVEQVNDTGALVDGIYIDWVEIEYLRTLSSYSDELFINYPSAQHVTLHVRKFSNPNIIVLDVTDPGAVRPVVNAIISGVPGLYSARVTVTTPPAGPSGESNYLFLAENKIKAPFKISSPAPRFDTPAAGADWIVIAPQSYKSSLDPLIQKRAGDGLRAIFISSEQVFDQFGYGIYGPEAIRGFLRSAYLDWAAPAPASVLLVGDSTIDPLNNLLTNIASQLPAPLISTNIDGEVPTDHYYACLVGNDPLPEMNVGRIPAANTTEVAAAVSKILARESAAAPGAWKTTVSHFSDKGVLFTSGLDALASGHVPTNFTVHKIYADLYSGTAATKAAIIAEFNAGAAITTYLGHGSFSNWSSNLNMTDAAIFTNSPKLPFSIALNCSNGYFASPTTQHGMAETLLLSNLGGSYGCFASAGLGFLSQLTPLASYTYDRFFAGQNLGSVTTGGKVDAYLQAGIHEDNLWQSLLFGDPASVGKP
ncbi:MAG: C25 family cysteine peptidase [Planctomycetota bacterium]